MVAGTVPEEVGQAGTSAEMDTAQRGTAYYGKEKDRVLVTLPLHDRNGDPVASVRLEMRSFPGQTQDNALVRAKPIVVRMESRVRAAKDLTE